MSWTNVTFSFGSSLPSSKMTQMMDNFTALAQGLSGAPKILPAALDPTTIHLLTSGTVISTTSGTTIDFTGIPSWAKRITLSFSDLSSSGNTMLFIQIGDSGGVETSGYKGEQGPFGLFGGVQEQNHSSYFQLGLAAATDLSHGVVVMTLIDPSTNTWCYLGRLSASTQPYITRSSGSKSLSGTLDRVRLGTSAGNFDNGKFNILYE